MSTDVHQFVLKIANARVTYESACYRPPSWPPPPDWVVTEDVYGEPLSLWGGECWDFSAWVGKSFILHFSGGSRARSGKVLGVENQNLMRLIATEIIWGPDGARSWSALKFRFNLLRRIVVLCESEGVLASDLSRYPRLLERLRDLFSKGRERQRLIVILDRLLRAEVRIGFTLIDKYSIARLSKIFSEGDNDDDDVEQTAYMPPRIWTYQILRLRECLDDFLENRENIERCFNFCVEAYAHNFGSLEAAVIRAGDASAKLPFTKQKSGAGAKNGRRFYGSFDTIAQSFGIDKLLAKWVVPTARSNFTIKSLTAYMTLVQFAGLAYIVNFTLQRVEEAGGLRMDCLIWEEDAILGRVAIIRGETTKTDPDSDAWWPTSPSVEVAVAAMTSVAKLRMSCASANPTVNCSASDIANPFLVHTTFEPWSSVPGSSKPYSLRPTVQSYKSVVRRFPLLFAPEMLRITEEDLMSARMFTPNLDKAGQFAVGKIWPLAYHQPRRTGAINMFASGLLSDSSIQLVLKHLTLLQTKYYGKNFSRLRFNEEFEAITSSARYEVIARQIEDLVKDRYVSPLGPERKEEIIVNLLSGKDFKALVKAGENNEVSFRETRLGGCAKNGSCPYGGIESIARCSGSDGGHPCRDAIYDKAKRPSVEQQLENLTRRGCELPDGRRKSALELEKQGLRNFLDVTND